MHPATHISTVKLFYYLRDAIALTEDEHLHLANCSHCQSLVEEYKKYSRAA